MAHLGGRVRVDPVRPQSDYDLVADFDGRIERVQVKTSISFHRERYIISLCTRGGNQSWNGIVKRLDATRCDRVFVHVGDGRRWFIPARDLGGDTSILLGGPKYAAYEIESAQPLPGKAISLD